MQLITNTVHYYYPPQIDVSEMLRIVIDDPAQRMNPPFYVMCPFRGNNLALSISLVIRSCHGIFGIDVPF